MTAIDPNTRAFDIKLPKLTLSTTAKVLIVLFALLLVWGLAIATFGVPALVYPMMVVVPGLLLALVLITWGM